jgi:accessory gene regulator B
MFSRVSERITENMVKSGTVDSEERDIYLYGVQQGLFVTLNIGVTIAAGLIFDVFWQLLIFTAALISLKSFAGGYHAKTPQRCFVISTLLTTSVALLIKYVSVHTFVCLGFAAFIQ